MKQNLVADPPSWRKNEIAIQKAVLVAIRDSTRYKDLNRGKQIHAAVAASRDRLEFRVASSLITMYSRCGCVDDARGVFDGMDSHDVVSWTAIILGYIENGDAGMALELFKEMLARGGCEPDARVFLAALKACSHLAAKEKAVVDLSGKMVKLESLERGMALHSQLAKKNWDVNNAFVVSSLVTLYGKCGAMADAWRVFEKTMDWADAAVWNSLLLGYAENGEPEITLDLLLAVSSPDPGTYVAALKACSSIAAKEDTTKLDGLGVKLDALEKGMAVHSQAGKDGFKFDVTLANTLIDMYANCGGLVDAKRVFDRLPGRDMVSWTTLILGYAENGESRVALQLFETMHQSGGCASDHRVFIAAAKACSGLMEKAEEGDMKLALEIGMAIHSRARKSDSKNVYLASCLIEMYSKCGSMVDAHRVFDGVPRRTVVLWNGLISGYAENDEGDIALELVLQMIHGGAADDRTFVAAFKACTGLLSSEQGGEVAGRFVKMASLEKGMAVHSRAQFCNVDSTTFVGNSLIDFYMKAGCTRDAERVFHRLQNLDVVTWNSVILGYAQNGDAEAALNLFSQMEATKCKADARSYVAVLKACSTLATNEENTEINGRLVKKTALETGLAIHSQTAKRDFDSDNFVGNSLCAMYAHCGSLVDAVTAFDRISRRCVISWTTLMIGYAENGEEELALEVLEWILSEKCCTPDSRTYAAALKACSNLATKELSGRRLAVKTRTLETGMAIHSQAAKSNFARDVCVESSLVDMYAKCGSLVDARMVFERMSCRDEVLTTTMIHAYAENGQGEMALQLFQETRARLRYALLNAWTFSAVLKACSCVAALEFGRAVHAESLQLGLESDAVLVNGLVDFYGKCGSMIDAHIVFDSSHKSGLTWSALIAGYSRQGDTSCVIDLFQEMLQDEDMKPGGITFLSVLTSCSHAGLFEKAKFYFREMQERHRISPDVEHYHAMIDMFGRANQLEEALAMVKAMPFKAEVITWTTLLAACVKWKNVQVGKIAFQSLLMIDEKNCASYVLMANNLLSGKERKSSASARIETPSQQNCSNLILSSYTSVKNG